MLISNIVPRVAAASMHRSLRHQLLRLGILLLSIGVFAASAHSSDAPRTSNSSDEPVAGPPGHEFDFLYGQWVVHNHLLKQRLANSHEWIAFEALDAFHALPGNLGSEENYSSQHWPDFVAIGLHLYDPAQKLWTLYWADNRNDMGTMQKLASGKFEGSIGTFYALDTFDDKPITVRILWKRVDQNHAHWEQAFSTDTGSTWETNWTMDFVRQNDT
jgi:hypothetical protein